MGDVWEDVLFAIESVTEGTIESADGITWYRVAGSLDGEATPLVCLHGGPGSTHNYFAPLGALVPKRPVVVYDQLGCGRSLRTSDRPWSLELFLDELRVLREQLALDRIHLLGTSWGGMLAIEHALRSEGIASIVLSSTLGSAKEWAEEARRLRGELPEDVVGILERHERKGTFDDPAYQQALEEFDRVYVFRGSADLPEVSRMRVERAPDVYRAMWGPNEWTITGALAGWDVRDRLSNLHMPCLVLRGRYDLCTESIAATLMSGIRLAKVLVFEESSHTPVLEERERYVRVVGDFLKEVDSADEA